VGQLAAYINEWLAPIEPELRLYALLFLLVTDFVLSIGVYWIVKKLMAWIKRTVYK
jgi:hypothetical protein